MAIYMYEQSGHVTLCKRIDSKREDRKITTWKVKTALGKALFFLRGEAGRLKRLFIFHLEMET